MPNQYAEGTATIYLRLPQAEKDRLARIVKTLNEQRPGANYTVVGIARAAVLQRIAELDKEITKLKST